MLAWLRSFLSIWTRRPMLAGLFFGIMLGCFYLGKTVSPTYVLEQMTIDVHTDDLERSYYIYKETPRYIQLVNEYDAILTSSTVDYWNTYQKEPLITEEFTINPSTQTVTQRSLVKHWKWWSLLPAFVAILLCWTTKEPLSALFGGILAGALLLGQYNITEDVLVRHVSSTSSAGVLILYLWLLGGLLGMWNRTGAAKAFAQFMTTHFVRGPKSAKLVAWGLGVLFFQGGSISTVLVGTTVKPLADKQKVSHEELAYIVDSTASPIASQIALNAWPAYVQSFIYVAGVSFLATESDRITFFFKSVPFCFYAILAVLGTFLLSIDKAPLINKQLKSAIQRSRTTGELDAPGASPLAAKELESHDIPEGYSPHVIDFMAPLIVLIVTAIGTFVAYGSPQVRVAFALSLATSMGLAIARGMTLKDTIQGIGTGLKSIVMGSIILMFAMIIGRVSQETGGGTYLVSLLGDALPYFLLPVFLQILTIIIGFSTGTSWGTYAVAFPLAMPLAWAIAQSHGLAHPELFMTICFAAVMDGSVFGDQCSPISDTTVLSAMCTGCDLMDHVKTQIPQASQAAIIAAVLWTTIAWFTA